MQVAKLLFSVVAVAGTLAAQNPTFSGIVNAASGIPNGFPNSAIAQGSVFLVYGTNLGAPPAAGTFYTAAPLPLPTTAGLAGTTITVTVNGTTVTAPMLFTLQTQVGAVMPSNTPAGTGTLTLTYNGKSASTPVTVAQSGFGLSNGYIAAGHSFAAATFGTNQGVFVSTTNTAKPGDILILWGTGLGPTTGSGDTAGAVAGNIGPAPQVFVGGVQSTSVAYWGRSPGSVGLDQIVFTVPPNAPLGCNVSVIVETMNGTTPVSSNGPTIALASTDGATCSDPTEKILPSYLSASSIKALAVDLQQNTFTSFNGNTTTTTTSQSAGVEFLQFSQAQLASQIQSTNSTPTFGSCSTGFVSGSGSGGGGPTATYLNAGTSVTLTPPSGKAISLSAQSQGLYSASGQSSNPVPSGTWMFSSTGGADVGPLNFSFTVPQQITWTNEAQVSTSIIDRTQPLLITWSGGDANGYVDIQGTGSIGPANAPTYSTYFECTAPTSAGQFTIPSSALLGMPTGANAFGSIQVSTYALPYTIGTVSGFNGALDVSEFQNNAAVIFK